MSGLKTRAEVLGVKPKVLAANIRRRIKTVRSKIEGIGAAFEDLDNSVIDGERELLAELDRFERTIEEAVEYLHETADYQ